jgi:hypothetical protein
MPDASALANAGALTFLRVAVFVSLSSGVVGVGSLVLGCFVLVRETRLAVFTITEDAETLGKRLGNDSQIG